MPAQTQALMETRPAFPTLTSLRFFAAFHVLLLHVVPTWLGLHFLSLPRAFTDFAAQGFVAVPFFYALSGFVLYSVYRAESFSSSARKQFWRKRFARLAPTFYLSLLIGAPLFVAALVAERGMPAGIALAALYFFLGLLFLGAWIPASLGFNRPGWSVSCEAFFYFLFPFLLPRLAGTSKKKAWILLACVFCLSFFPPVLGHIFLVPVIRAWPVALYSLQLSLADLLEYNPAVHLGEFAFGMVLAHLYVLSARSTAARSDALLLLGVLLAVATVALGNAFFPALYLHSFLLLPAFGIILWGAAGPRTASSAWLESRVLLCLGEASYSLYILHDPLKNLVNYAWQRFFPSIGAIPVAIAFLAAMPLLSVASYRFLEAPLRKKLAG